jgi:hypothetical protein
MRASTWVHSRRKPVVAALAGVIVVMVITSAVALAVGVEDEAQSSSTTSEPTLAPAPKESRSIPTVDLSALIIPTPSGFSQIPDEQATVSGKVDVAAVVKDRTDQEGSRRHLIALGFTDAFVRSWQKPGGSLERITVRLYQFGEEKSAADYAKSSLQVLQDDHKDAQVTRVAGTTDAVAIDVRPQDGYRLAFAFGRRGRVTMVIAAVLPPPALEAVAPIARQQLSLMPEPA